MNPKDNKYRPVGRTPLNPMRKLSIHIHALVTPPIAKLLEERISAMHGDVSLSDLIRLALYRLIERDGAMTAEVRDDPSWKSLEEKGLV